MLFEGVGRMKKENRKKVKEIRKYMNNLLHHLGHHCCAINSAEHNRILMLTHDLEEIKELVE